MGTQPETADTDKGNLQCLFDSLLLGATLGGEIIQLCLAILKVPSLHYLLDGFNCADHLDCILKGVKPADIHTEHVTKANLASISRWGARSRHSTLHHPWHSRLIE
jgi:hypothetical protein